MAFVAMDGRLIDVPTRDDYDPDAVNRAKDLAMLELRQRKKWSLRAIGVFFGVSHVTVKRRLDNMPDKARGAYASPLG